MNNTIFVYIYIYIYKNAQNWASPDCERGTELEGLCAAKETVGDLGEEGACGNKKRAQDLNMF